jgi:carboxyl-terminal processing protease
MFKKNKKIILSAFVATATSLMLTTSALSAKNTNSKDDKLQAYLKFTRVLNLVEEQYVEELNSTTIINKAIKGLLSNLDAHSAFLDEKAFKDLNVQTKGEFGGLGIVIGMKKGALTVIAPIDDTPAKRAGIKAGDIILKINDKSTLGMTIDEAVNLMRGKPKTKITLTIVRKGESKPLIIDIVRDIIKIQSVKHKFIYLDKDKKEKVLYIQISSFDSKVVSGVQKVLDKNPDAKGVIMDLRNNPGGLLSQATGLLDMFINQGILVSQKGRDKAENIIYKAHSDGKYPKIPMTILVNGGSASASEIVSGAMQDHKRAPIIGEKTFGKGSVQIVVPLNEKEGIKLTVARYYLPSGRTIQNKGVEPDIIVYPGEATKKKEDEFTLKEAELKEHLKTELEKVDKKNKKDKKSSKKEDKKDKTIITTKDIYKDAQLKSAYDILKVLILEKGK